MKVLSSQDIKSLDAYTIAHEPVASVDLMERAATACYRRITRLVEGEKIVVVCGKGNNGGDGLAVARMLLESQHDCTALVIETGSGFTADAQANFDRLKKKFPKRLSIISNANELNGYSGSIAIDALFGTGLSRAPEGLAADAIEWMNTTFKKIVSIDVPSGLFIDKPSAKPVVRSTVTLTFQVPKLAFLLPDNREFVPEFELLDIGLHKEGMRELNTRNYYLQQDFVSSLVKKRNKFSHKGDFGHALLIGGSRGMSGAVAIAAEACLRSGAGLLTVHSVAETLSVLRNRLPEAMTSVDGTDSHISEIHRVEGFNAIGFGPGAGTHEDTARALKKLLQYHPGPMVIDADGLNILAENKTWLSFLPPETILTPHPGEFARLTEKHNDGFDALEALRQFCTRHQCLTILKGAHSAIGMPDGNVFFNSTGNPSLAKGGSGDCLTGIMLGLLARGYRPPHAAILGTYVHGLAADLLIRKRSQESVLATDVIRELPKAFRKLE